MLAACASTATGRSTSSLASLSAPQSLQAELPTGTVMAVVRYPAFVEEAASEKFYKAMGEQAIGGTITDFNPDNPEVRAISDSVILKSNYFAQSLYKELAAKLPEHSVLLSPHVIKLGDDDKLTSEPMTQAESLAHVVAVDFTAYSFPDPEKMMQRQPLTFGDLITPLVTVHTDHRAAVTTQGLRLASAPLIKTSARNGQDQVFDSLENIQSGRLKPTSRELDFIAHLKKDTPLQIATRRLSTQNSPDAVTSFPLEKISMNDRSILSLNDSSAGVEDPLDEVFSEDFAHQIVNIINQTDINKSVMAARAASIAQFDDNLAALTFVGHDSADYQSRFRYAERLLDAEKKYLSVQSLRLFDGVHNGEMGAQVRDMLQAEHSILEERRRLAREQNTAAALGLLAAVAAGGLIATTGDNGGRNLGQLIGIDALINGAIFAGQRAYATSIRSRAVGENYLSAIVPALEAQTSVQVDLIDSNETITAIRFEDLSTQLQTLYNDNQRGLETIATRCSYTHTSQEKVGTWLGECQAGVAQGSGVGVYTTDDGKAVEYFGFAQNGQPHGAGYMLSHTPTGSTALEGQFSMGQADGIIRVSSPGKAPQLRQYSVGKDVGSAPRGSVVISPFDPNQRTNTSITAALQDQNQSSLTRKATSL